MTMMKIRENSQGGLDVDFGHVGTLSRILGSKIRREPRFIYRYSQITDYLLESLSEKYLWFSKPFDFNDPLDCKIIIEHGPEYLLVSPEVIRAAASEGVLPRELAKNIVLSPELDYLKRYNVNIRRLLSDSGKESVTKVVSYLNYALRAKKLDEEMGVCCFTVDPKNILMWSHYGAQHRGVCLKYRRMWSRTAGLWNYVLPVKYHRRVPRFKMKVGDDPKAEVKIILSMLLSKSHQWRYEREWRALSFNGPGQHALCEEDLLEVIFGVNASSEDVEKIREIVSRKEYRHVKLRKISLGLDRYSLYISDLEST